MTNSTGRRRRIRRQSNDPADRIAPVSRHVTWSKAVGAIVLVSLLGAACQSAPAAPEGFSAYAQNLATSVSPFQAEILEDGEVTFSEYERAMRATRQCLIDTGWEVSEVREHPRDGWSLLFTIEWDYDGDDAREARLSAQIDVDFMKCASEYHESVEVAYRKTLIPSDEERQEEMNKLLACLESEGVTGIPADADQQQFYDAIEAEIPDGGFGILCMDRYLYLFETLQN